jgi:penicillin amidase
MDDTGPVLWRRSLSTRSFQDALEGVLARNDASWCDDRHTVVVETCDQQAGLALDRALDELQARYGNDASRWKWGAAHQARSEHRPFSRVKLLAPLFELRTPVGGDTHTVNVSRVGLRADATTAELYLNEHAASMRGLYDLGDPAQSRVMHSTGQSGIVFSEHYRSFVESWRDVRYVPLWPKAEPQQVLTVLPGGPAR